MAKYKKVLVAVDLSDHSEAVVRRAMDIAGVFGADITLLHVVEYVPVEPMGEALLPAVDIEEELVQGARRRLEELAQRTGLEDAGRRVETGTIKAEVVRVAGEWEADLVVLGSRERHGVAVMLNLAEDTILHAAPCDVLAVRVRS
jgi:universal stress protein A